MANAVPAIENSPIDDDTFNQVFAFSPIAVLASMIAYLIAQFVDIRIYHFGKSSQMDKCFVKKQFFNL